MNTPNPKGNLIALGAGVGALTLLGVMALHAPSPEQNPSVSPQPIINDDSETRYLDSHPSMIPIQNLAELRAILRADSALAEFDLNNGFDVGCATMDTVSEGGWYQVSWRKGNKFGFSSHEQYIPAGTSIVRSCKGGILKAKCGNVIVPTYRGSLDPIALGPAPLGPHDDDTTLGAAAPQGLLVETPLEPIKVGPNPPWEFSPAPVPYGCCGIGGIVTPPVQADEPSMLMQTLTGIMIALYVAVVRRRPRS